MDERGLNVGFVTVEIGNKNYVMVLFLFKNYIEKAFIDCEKFGFECDAINKLMCHINF